jgi:NET1-associated nuclear protein 1 (U3 small nucleolar RNA-associated protein 17)
VGRPSQVLRIGKVKTARSLSISASGKWLIVIGGTSAYVAETASSSSGFVVYDSPERLTALATHPKEDYFATGDAVGQIRLWYCLNGRPVANQNTRSNGNKAQTTTMHWHAHAVSSLAFTSNGAYLVSGGEESVVVVWQLHSGKREFVPRVGAPIACITVRRTASGDEEYLVGLVDGSYVFIHAGTLSANRVITRVKLGGCNIIPLNQRVVLTLIQTPAESRIDIRRKRLSHSQYTPKRPVSSFHRRTHHHCKYSVLRRLPCCLS